MDLPHPTEQESHGTIQQLLCAVGLSYLPSGMPTFGNGPKPGILQEERKGPLGLCSCHASHVSCIPPLAPAAISKGFPAFLITPFSAPTFQEARGLFQCPGLLAKLLSAGISLFPDSGGVEL